MGCAHRGEPEKAGRAGAWLTGPAAGRFGGVVTP